MLDTKSALEKFKKLNYIYKYTIAFILTFLITFFYFYFRGKSFIWVHDGLTQHAPALTYYGQYLRQLIRNIIYNHSFSLPEYSFSLGYGAGIVPTLHYYAIGDPLNLLSAIVPSAYSEYLFNFLVILRFYLAGLCFSYFAKYFCKNEEAILIGALGYIFTANTLVSIRHPFFINPYIYFPLLLLSIEKIIYEGKHYRLSIAVFLTLVSNFYFGYMLSLFTILYLIIRYFSFYEKYSLKTFFIFISQFISPVLIGVAMSAVIFIPVVYAFLSGPRGAGVQYDLLYSIKHYANIIGHFFTTQGDLYTLPGVATPLALAMILLFGKKNTNEMVKAFKLSYVILFIFILFPFFGSLSNGLNYVINRYMWVLNFTQAYTFVFFYEDFFKPSMRQLKFSCIFIGVYALVLILLDKGVSEESFTFLLLMTFLSFFVILHRLSTLIQRKTLGYIIFACALLSISLFGKYRYSAYEHDTADEYISSGTFLSSKTEDSPSSIVKEYTAKKDYLARYDNYLNYALSYRNADLLTGSRGISSYWSMGNANVGDYTKQLGLSGMTLSYVLYNLNSRTILESLSSVKYYTVKKNDSTKKIIPYGFEKINEKTTSNNDTYYIYENKYALPLGYTYDSYIDKETFKDMNASQRQEALLYAVYLDTDDELKIKQNKTALTQTEIPYTLSVDKNIYQNGDLSFISNKNDTVITLDFEAPANCETYLLIEVEDITYQTYYELYHDEVQESFSLESYEELTFDERQRLWRNNLYSSSWDENTKTFDLYIKSANSGTNYIHYYTPYNAYYYGHKQFLINLGYSTEEVTQATITLPTTGTYEFKDIKVISQPLTNYEDAINNLKENILENELVGEDKITGTVSLEEAKVLVLTIPYDSGWRAYVDGERVDLIKANLAFSALQLDAGTHNIELIYQTPGLRLGFFIAMMGFGIFIALIFFDKCNSYY